jgi:WD40 repeat protein
LTRGELASVIGGGAVADGVIERLVESRLVVAHDAEGEDRIEITHEALIDAWPRLVGWRREDAEGARLRDQLRTAARQWDARGRPRGLLWRDDALVEYQLWRARYPGSLTEVEDAFGQSSTADAARGRRIRRVVLAVAFAILAAGLVVLFSLRTRAEVARNHAHDQLLQSYEEQGRRAMLDGDPMSALVFFDAAFGQGADSPALRFLISRTLDSFDGQVASLEGHGREIRVVTYAPDGSRIATAGDDGTVRLWNASTGAPLAVIGDHQPGAVSVAWSPDGARVASGDTAGRIRIWRAADGGFERTLEHARTPTAAVPSSVAFSPDGRHVASANEQIGVEVWRVDTGERIASMAGSENVTYAEFSPRSDRLIGASQGGTAIAWHLDGRRIVDLSGHQGPIWRARYSRDGTRVVTNSIDRTARIWDAESGQPLAVLRGHEQRVTDATFSPDGATIATASADRTARIWNASSGELRHVMRGHAAQVNRLLFVDDATLITVAGDGTARVWDVRSGIEIATLAHGGFVFDVAASPDRDRVTTASWDGTARVWRLDRTRRIGSWPPTGVDPSGLPSPPRIGRSGALVIAPPRAAVFDPATGATTAIDGAWAGGGAIATEHPTAALVDADGALAVFALGDGGARRQATAPVGSVGDIAIDRDGKVVATCSAAGEVATWDAISGAAKARARRPTTGDGECRLHVAPDGRSIVVAFTAGAIDLMDAATLSSAIELGRGELYSDAAFSPDGRYVAVTADTATRIWTIDGREQPPVTLDASAISLAWSRTSERLLIGTADGKLTVWRGGATPVRFRAHDNFVVSAVFAPDDNLVLTSGGDGSMRIWDVGRQRQLASIPTPGLAFAAFDHGGRRVVSFGPQHVEAWRLDAATFDRASLHAIARCRVGRELRDGQLVESARSRCE